MRQPENDKKLRAKLFTELVKEQNIDPNNMTPAAWVDLYAELNRRMAAAKKENAVSKQAFGQDVDQIEAEDRARAQRVKKITSCKLPDDFVNPFMTDPELSGVYIESSFEALNFSIEYLGEVDICLIARVTGKELTQCISDLRGLIYRNPEKWEECFYKGFEIAEVYLSGNVLKKLAVCRRANEYYDGFFAENEVALMKVMPKGRRREDIHVALGSPWIPPYIIDQFICYLLGGKLYSRVEPDYIPVEYRTLYDPASATWYIPEKGRYAHSSRSCRVFGTPRMEALHILEQTLNGRTVQVFDDGECVGSNTVRVVNRAESLQAQEKQELIKRAFNDWVWKDQKRTSNLVRAYNERFCGYVTPSFDGSNLKFAWMNNGITLYPYQKNAVAKMIFTKSVLLAHDVGSGKTFEMIAAACELRKMKQIKKPMFVVPNSIVGQWAEIFRKMKRHAKLLVIEPKGFTPNKRQSVLQDARDNDYDGIIIAYSCFELIPLSYACRREMLEVELEAINEKIRRSGKIFTKVKNRERKMREEIAELGVLHAKGGEGVCFDHIGVDAIFLDEAHNYKNLPIDTKCEGLLGINKIGSAKCTDMMDRVQLVRSKGGRVVFATGTPITNSVSDIYTIQAYLQRDELERLGLVHFDAWTGMYAEKTADFEIDVTTETYRMATRFRNFYNLPELTTLFGQVADFHSVDPSAGIPVCDGYNDNVVERSVALGDYLSDIAIRADRVRSGQVQRTEDNMLKITTDGRKAALDIRLVRPDGAFDPASKVAICSDNVVKIWKEGAENKLTQLVFSDIGTPKSGFNLYDELKRLLVEKGIPPQEIAFIHDYDTDKKREVLFSDFNAGKVRVLVGSTIKLGIGVNVQERLVALHHLDVPWRPADMVQREGRILRQGNMNSKVQIFRYIANGSFDAYSWQLLESKQRFICSLLSGSVNKRREGEIDSVVLDYAEVKALALGNPLLRMRVEAANELHRVIALERKEKESRTRMSQKLAQIPAQLDALRERVSATVRDIEIVQNNPTGSVAVSRKSLGEVIMTAIGANYGQSAEHEITKYRGFAIVTPAGLQEGKPAIWLVANGRYYLELGTSATGSVTRIDNRLSTLTDVLIEYNRRLEELEAEKSDIEKEIAKENPYTAMIVHLRERLAAIDRKLDSSNTTSGGNK